VGLRQTLSILTRAIAHASAIVLTRAIVVAKASCATKDASTDDGLSERLDNDLTAT
jgi:hypothetical protein